MPKSDPFSRNLLLARLSPEDRDLLRGELEQIALPRKFQLHVTDMPVDHVYFLTSGVASLFTTLADGARSEVGMAGREGMVGSSVVLTREMSSVDAEMQVPGHGVRLPARSFRRSLAASATLTAIMLRYVSTFVDQVSQTAACNRHHVTEERLARWLLVVRDRIDSDHLPLTHEYIATMLGVRRAGVTVAAGILAKAGLIEYRPGHITILDRARLQDCSCECYAVEKRRFHQGVRSLIPRTARNTESLYGFVPHLPLVSHKN